MTIETKEEVTTGIVTGESPNENYADNPALDENGNPIESASNKDTDTTTQETTVDTEEVETTTEEVDTRDQWTNLDSLAKLEKFLTEASLKPSDVSRILAENGGKLTPEALKALEDKHGVGVAALLADQLKQVHTDMLKQVDARDKQVFKLLEAEFEGITTQSGEATFKELKQWAEKALPNAERTELNGLLQKGGLSAQLAIKYLSSTFKEQADITIPAGLVTNASVPAPKGVQALTRSEYNTKLRELEAKGHVYGQSKEMAQLDAQRQAGIKRGI